MFCWHKNCFKKITFSSIVCAHKIVQSKCSPGEKKRNQSNNFCLLSFLVEFHSVISMALKIQTKCSYHWANAPNIRNNSCTLEIERADALFEIIPKFGAAIKDLSYATFNGRLLSQRYAFLNLNLTDRLECWRNVDLRNVVGHASCMVRIK